MSAQILPFTPRERAAPRREADAGFSPAIVIFPGVRYERLEDEHASGDAPVALPAQRH